MERHHLILTSLLRLQFDVGQQPLHHVLITVHSSVVEGIVELLVSTTQPFLHLLLSKVVLKIYQLIKFAIFDCLENVLNHFLLRDIFRIQYVKLIISNAVLDFMANYCNFILVIIVISSLTLTTILFHDNFLQAFILHGCVTRSNCGVPP